MRATLNIIALYLAYSFLQVYPFVYQLRSKSTGGLQDKSLIRSYSSSTVTTKKGTLLKEISNANKINNLSNRQSILDAIQELEGLTTSPVTVKSIDGDWSLVYSTQTTKNAVDADTIVDKISEKLYKLFFKFAPFLAGGLDAGNTSTPRFIKTTNKQYINVTTGTVNNTVAIKIGDWNSIITVVGTVRLANNGEPALTLLLIVIFTDFAIRFGDTVTVRLPLPRPKGSLATTFCDGDIRVSRGGRGGIFVAKKVSAVR